ncbi:hypothetical protein ACIP6V_36020 [Streptomyces sp. NPDC088770]|uniref:hypothetical protein n=1 Tax=unclassified Streptomyces TaxID=2593676 RepID=UPI00381DF5F3
MKHNFGRRFVTSAAALAVAAGALLTMGGTASAAPAEVADHTAVVAYHSSDRTQYGDHHDHRDTRWNGHHDRHDTRWDGHHDRHDTRWDGHHDRHDTRWDGHRKWVRIGSGWYCNDHGRQYRYDGHWFYVKNNGAWHSVSSHDRGFDHRIFN